LVCGLNTDDLTQLASGIDANVLDLNKELSITVELERNDRDGKDYPRIRWVNELGGAGFKNEMSKDEAVAKMSGMNLKADVMRLRAEKVVTTRKPAVNAATGADLGELPF
jgi:hypothetical protein